MISVIGFLVVAAFIATIVSAVGKCPLWIAVLLLCVAELVRILPIGR
jgi:hypothetical protein